MRPESHIHECHLFAFLAVFRVYCRFTARPRSPPRSLLACIALRVTGEISEQNDFIETGHAPLLAELLAAATFFAWLGLSGLQPLVMLAINFGIELEFRPQFRDQLRIGVENEIRVVTRVEFAGSVGKLPFVHLLHLLDLGAFLLKFGFQAGRPCL